MTGGAARLGHRRSDRSWTVRHARTEPSRAAVAGEAVDGLRERVATTLFDLMVVASVHPLGAMR